MKLILLIFLYLFLYSYTYIRKKFINKKVNVTLVDSEILKHSINHSQLQKVALIECVNFLVIKHQYLQDKLKKYFESTIKPY